MPIIVVIADDFTGANDTAVKFSKKGFETVVTTDLTQFSGIKADVVVLDTETRHLDQEQAYQSLQQVAITCREINPGYIYKKIDSTLRGNIGAEIEALMDELSIPTAVMIPAMPSNGRQTIGGYQLVGGVPLQKTDIARDPLNPVHDSYLPRLIAGQVKRPVTLIALDHVLQGKEALIDALKQAARGLGEILIIDAATGEDLEVIAEALKEMNLLSFTIGPADFAAQLARLMVAAPVKTKSCSVLTVAGSVNQVTQKQVEYLANQADILVISMASKELLIDSGLEEEKDRLRTLVQAALAQEKDIVLCTAQSKVDVEKALEQGAKIGLNNKEVAEKIARNVGEITAFLINHFALRSVVLTGGDIAIATYNALGLQGIKIQAEVLPGIPYGIVDTGEYQGLRLITKAGAFGDKNALFKSIKFLKGQSE